jgi:outer membrane usher protein FimD/PapC
MLFVQTAAPTGWTKSTSHDNKALRIVSGTAGSGGSVAFTTVFGSQTPSGSVSVSVGAGTLAVGAGSFAVGATTLATSQIPSHYHHTSYSNNASIAPRYGSTNTSVTKIEDALGGSYRTLAPNTSSTGDSGSHTHSLTGAPSISGSPSVTSSSFTGTALDLAVQYVDAIIAIKD